MHISALFSVAMAVPGTDWFYQFTNNITSLTTANGGALTSFGLTLLSIVAMFKLIQMVISYSTSTMTFSFDARPLEAGQIVNFLIRLAVCSLLETYWNTAVPGTSMSLNHFFSGIAQTIVSTLDAGSLANLKSLLNTATAGIDKPTPLEISEVACYFFVQLLMGIASAILFVINISAVIFYAVAALFGPIFIPFLMTDSLKGKFYTFVETLASFAMIRAVAAAFIFVWEGFLNTFLSQTFAGDYTIKMWLANLVPVTTVFVAFIVNMLFIPQLTQAIFGGGAALAGAVSGAVVRAGAFVAVKGAMKGAA